MKKTENYIDTSVQPQMPVMDYGMVMAIVTYFLRLLYGTFLGGLHHINNNISKPFPCNMTNKSNRKVL
jgi:hypothetical protein